MSFFANAAAGYKTGGCPLVADAPEAPRLPRKLAILDTAAELIAAFPQLADVRAPAPVMRLTRPRTFDPVAELANYVRAGIVRLSARTPEGMLGPLVVQGNCLGRLIRPGDRLYLDPRRVAGDGDLVVIAVGERVMASTINRLVHDAQFCEAHSNALPNVWVKLVRHVHGRRMVFESGGYAPLERFRLLGVVGYVERDGRAV